ncbi:hypothetical protein AGMMS4952_11970 [Spirochaetia bacterium]|nr:hypothetical protein AGMMS4952_11970 [Spirochaetia bacterium]
MRLKSFTFTGIMLFLGLSQTFGQELSISTGDMRIEQRVDGGFHLFIRKTPGVNSVLLTESTRDPTLNVDNYAYRTTTWNPVNGDEIRLLNGAPIPRETGILSIIDSSPEPDSQFGQAFHLYIPNLLYYGYQNTRHGEVYVVDGTYLNIRAFALPYGDYRSSFQDNPFVVQVTQKPLEGPPEGNYMKDTVNAYTEIISNQGELVYSTGADDVVDKITDMLQGEDDKTVDLVICLDTTGSMRDDIDSLRRLLIDHLKKTTAGFKEFRVGMVLYKDYYETYLTRVIPFTRDFEQFQTSLNNIRVGGGRDIPEAVHEALYDGATKFPWDGETKIMILVGDAPPHPRQRGTVSKEMVDQAVEERDIRLNAIILPQ